jgi:hypothetical protein
VRSLDQTTVRGGALRALARSGCGMIGAPRQGWRCSQHRMPPSTESTSPHRTLQLVALMEAVKGFIVFGAGFGLLTLLHRDVRGIAESLVTHLHIDPDEHFASIFLNAAAHLTDARLWALAALTVAYSSLRMFNPTAAQPPAFDL